MKIYRPLWEDGAFLTPQQFQQQALWDAHMAQTVARMALANPWGVVTAEFDDGALALSRLNATRLVVRFPDGTLVDTDLSDNLPPVCDLNGITADSVGVVLALPLLSANGGNLDDGRDSERPRRWKQERVSVQELTGHEQTDIPVLRHALTLRLAHQENTAWLTCPVARLVRNAQGQWVRDTAFIPPMMALSGSPSLLARLRDLLHRLQARRLRLMAMRREANERMADFAVADVSLFWLLNALNGAAPVLSDLLESPALHPELVFRELVRLTGSLMTFSLEHDLKAIPAYRHETPEQVFGPLLSLLDQLLEASLPSRVVPVVLKQNGAMWKGDLHDARLREGADFWLSVRSSMPTHELQARFPQLCKAGSFDDVSEVVNVAMSGMAITPVSHVPAAIPVRLDNLYFALDLNSDAGRAMLAAGNCSFYTPAALGDVQLELFAVLRT
ncbi:type VI secretion system baseplate subunit TssK [Enterobacter asburiae]|uniref:type VI secretion system baseplate subunit TssK n=1 Tax=Enterobacter asburiae TaxID=61645 RepID=UPI0021D22A17|nr:type VI secretion system baseplate subunit TssK [Enterobacter asburiae]MCU6239923.1 type VI secretion system baseplate subunit TssK [Enterobacter asburiae]